MIRVCNARPGLRNDWQQKTLESLWVLLLPPGESETTVGRWIARSQSTLVYIAPMRPYGIPRRRQFVKHLYLCRGRSRPERWFHDLFCSRFDYSVEPLHSRERERERESETYTRIDTRNSLWLSAKVCEATWTTTKIRHTFNRLHVTQIRKWYGCSAICSNMQR